jgi:Domain of unknown function DUF11
MRKLYFFAALAAVGVGLAGWSSMGTAQPLPELPPIEAPKSPAKRDKFADPLPPVLPEPAVPLPGLKAPKPDLAPVGPMPKPRPVDDPFADPLPGLPVKPSIDAPVPGTKTPSKPAVSEPIKLPEIVDETPLSDVKPLTPKPIPAPIVKPVTTPMPTPVVKPTEPIKVETKPATEKSLIITAGPGTAATGTAPESSMTTNSSQPSASKQEPSICLEWMGPTALKVGTPADYTLMVRNTCPIPVQKVIVQVRVPQGVTVAGSEPKADGTEGVLMWDLGTLLSRQEKPLKMRFVPPAKGDINCQAWVTFTGSASMKVQVREPKLLVKATAPDKVLVGDPANVILTVSNPGDYQAEQVKVAVALGEGLESARGNKPTIDIGTLAAGETRTVTIPCLAKVSGEQKCEASVEGDGLKAKDSLSMNIIQPRLDLEVTGPKLRYLDRKATYTFKVTNPGDAPATNVFVTEMIPAGFKFVSADNGGQHDFASRTVKWFVGEVGPGQTREVKAEMIAVNTGDFSHKVIASASRGIKSEKDLPTKIEGLSALLMEVVDVDDPVEVNSETAYEIRITNTGSRFENDVKLVCTIPPQMKFKSCQGPVKYEIVGNEVVFQTLPKLAPKADATFKVIVTAAAKGDARFKATLTSGSLTEPVIKQESTRVYED